MPACIYQTPVVSGFPLASIRQEVPANVPPHTLENAGRTREIYLASAASREQLLGLSRQPGWARCPMSGLTGGRWPTVLVRRLHLQGRNRKVGVAGTSTERGDLSIMDEGNRTLPKKAESLVPRGGTSVGGLGTSLKLPLRRVRAIYNMWFASSSSESSNASYTMPSGSEQLVRPGWPLGIGRPGDGLSFLRLVAPIALVFPPVLARTTRDGDKTSPGWPCFIIKLQVNCESEAAGCLVTSTCG